MQTGTYISGLGHIALIGFAFFGGAFQAEPLPLDVQEVAVITSDAFEALLEAQEPPGVSAEPTALAAPEALAPAPDVTSEIDEDPERVAPLPTTPPAPVETLPDTPPPVPPAELTDTSPQLVTPQAEIAVALPPDARPQPRPSERVAPRAVAPPEPEAVPDPIEREAIVEEQGEAEVVQEPQEATAPEEAASEIVTEAEEPAGAPTRSMRPSSRPIRRASAPPQTERATTNPVDDAVAAALAETTQPRAPSGPPLSSGERDALRVSVSGCWNVGSLSTAALQTTVIVAVDMQEDGRPIAPSIRMLSFSGGTESAARQAYEAARRAIIRCGARGFPLPAEKYDHWREIEMTFNPENMRVR